MLKDSVPTIRNELKLPAFMKFYTDYEIKYEKHMNIIMDHQEYTYNKRIPSLDEIIRTGKVQERKNYMESQSFRKEQERILHDVRLLPTSVTAAKDQTEKLKLLEIDKKLK